MSEQGVADMRLLEYSRTSSSTQSSSSSSSTLMDDVMARWDGRQDDPAMLLKRLNSLLGLNDNIATSPIVVRPSKRSPESERAQLIPLIHSFETPSSSMSSTASKLKCGWLGCWTVDDAE